MKRIKKFCERKVCSERTTDSAKLDPWNWQEKHDSTMKLQKGKDLLLLNQPWKLKMSSRNSQWQTYGHRGSCENQCSPGVAVHPNQGESQHLVESHQKDYPSCQETDGNTGGCVSSSHVQLLNSLEEWAPARHWLELPNKANFSCQRKWNLQRTEIINSLVNISGVDRNLREDKKVHVMNQGFFINLNGCLIWLDKYPKHGDILKGSLNFSAKN